MNHFKKLITASALFTATAAVAFAEAPRPNIVMIMCDDLGYSDVGFTGSPDIQTPAMDLLAESGTICTSGYVTHPFCGPSRMGLLTGRYPHKFGGQFNLPPTQLGIEEYNKLGVPVGETLISKVLQDAGYYTGIIGKWHLGEEAPYHPNNRGFDDFYGFLSGGHNYFPEQYSRAYASQQRAGRKLIHDYLRPLEHNGEPTTEDEYLTDELSNHAVWFIEQAAQKDQPFFLFLSYNAPHSPMEALESDMAPYAHIADKKRRTLAGMMAAVDRGVGRVTQGLKDTGEYENTLIIFLSDNGGKPSSGSSNEPFRGEKGDTWEGGFRVPMFFHWANRLPAQKFDFPVSSIDFFPTFAALAGAQIPAGKELDGKNIFNGLAKGENPRPGEMIYAMRHRNSYSDISARQDDWKIVRYNNQPWRLFNITNDLGENNDLASQYPERLEGMVKAAKQWSQSHVQPLFFHAEQARDQWNQNNMPNFDMSFQPVIGASPLPKVTYVTDQAAPAKAPVPVPAIVQPASPPAGVKLKNGDTLKADFVAREKIKWAQKGWNWNQSKVEENFDAMDTNGDGIASGAEKKAFWNK